MSVPSKPPLKILMLHGYTQSGPLFHAKTRALQKSLTRALPAYNVQFTFPTAPHRLLPAEKPSTFSTSTKLNPGDDDVATTGAIDEAYGWWRRTSDHPPIYDGMTSAFETLATTISAAGPFDGVIGFSQGAALAAMLASALDGRAFPSALTNPSLPPPFHSKPASTPIQPPLRFCIVYSGFRAMDARCTPLFEPHIATPGMHFLGQMDGVVEEARSQALITCWDKAHIRVVVHPGGHFLPSQRPWLDAVVGFISELVGARGDLGKQSQRPRQNGIQDEQRVEDMELPFSKSESKTPSFSNSPHPSQQEKSKKSTL